MTCATVVLFVSLSGKISDVTKRDAEFPNWASKMPCVPERDTQGCREKILTLNSNNFFFLGTLKILNSRKLDNLSILQLLKFEGDSSETVIHFFVF